MTKYDTSKKEDVIIYKVDIEAQKELAKRFNIRGIPVLAYLKDGKVIAQEQGVKTAQKIRLNVINYLDR